MENKAVCARLLNDIEDRGFDPAGGVLFVIDGGKAIYHAIRDKWSDVAAVQRSPPPSHTGPGRRRSHHGLSQQPRPSPRPGLDGATPPRQRQRRGRHRPPPHRRRPARRTDQPPTRRPRHMIHPPRTTPTKFHGQRDNLSHDLSPHSPEVTVTLSQASSPAAVAQPSPQGFCETLFLQPAWSRQR